jgi:glycosyltransferase involved in cell wall biosynthesis
MGSMLLYDSTPRMHVASFAEGAWGSGIGVGAPRIAESLAARGYEATLLVGGRNPSTAGTSHDGGTNSGRQRDVPRGLRIIAFRSIAKWAFSISMVIPAIRAVRRADVVYLHSLYSFPVLLGSLLARWYGKPYLLQTHGVLAPFQRRVGRHKKWFYDRLFARRILKSSAAMIYTANGEREEARSYTPPVASLVVPYGFDVEDFAELPERGAFRAAYLSNFSGPVVTFLGRLNAKKGLEILAEAFAKLVPRFNGNIRLAIIGSPDPLSFRRTLASILRKAGVGPYTVVTGPINDPKKKTQAFVDCDCFVVPSVAENFCFALFEAMACRAPVVVSETINFAQTVVSYGAGMAVSRDPERFADAIEAILRDPAQQRAMGAGGRRLAEVYSWPACGERLDRIIQCIVGHQPFPADVTNG